MGNKFSLDRLPGARRAPTLSPEFSKNELAIGNAYVLCYRAPVEESDKDVSGLMNEHYALCLDLAGDSVVGDLSYKIIISI